MKQFRKYWLLLLIAATLPTQMWGADKTGYVKVTAFNGTYWIKVTLTEDTSTGNTTLKSMNSTELDGTCDIANVWTETGGKGTKLAYNIIGTGAFQYAKTITSFTLPTTVKKIEAGAFIGCNGLKTISLSTTLETIGKNAFKNCTSLTTITIPNTVTSIGSNAFDGCTSLASVNLGSGVTKIEDYAFTGCTAMTTLSGGANLITIGKYAFQNCTKLSTISWTTMKKLEVIDENAFLGCTSITTLTGFQASLRKIDSWAFKDCTSLTTLTIPVGVKNLAGSFQNCVKLTTVTLNMKECTYLPAVFYGCTSLQKVVIPNGVTEMSGTFTGCTALTSVTLPSTLVKLYPCFDQCSSLETLTIPGNVEMIEKKLLKNTSVKTLILSEGITSLESWNFAESPALESVTIPSTIKTIGIYAFEYCTALTTFNWKKGNGETTIGRYAFSNCSKLPSITIPTGVKTIESYVFYLCNSLKEVTVSEGVSTLSDYAFANADALTTVNLPSTLRKVGKYVLSCQSLSEVNWTPSEEEIAMGEYMFFGDMSLKSITIPSGIKSISGHAFMGCGNLESVTLPEGLTQIGMSAFHGCSSLKGIQLPTTLGGIYACAFMNSGLTNIEFPESVSAIGREAFKGCRFTSLTIPSLYLGGQAFANCSALQEVNLLSWYGSGRSMIPNHTDVNEGDSVFYNCPKLETVTLGPDALGIGDYAFHKNQNLKTLHIQAKNLSKIGQDAFSNCIALNGVTLPESETTISIEKYAFMNCYGIKDLVLPNVRTQEKAFFNCGVSNLQLNQGSLGVYTFSKCNQLVNVTIPDDVGVGSYVFADCARLKTCRLPSNMTQVPSGLFSGCLSLTDLQLTDNITQIGDHSYSQCTGLTSINDFKNVTIIFSNAFSDCTSLASVNFSKVNKLYSGAFSGCSALASLEFPETLTSVGSYCFKGCTSLTTVDLPDYVSHDGYLFSGCTGLVTASMPTTCYYDFEDCTALTTLTIRGGEAAVRLGAPNMTKLTLCEGVTMLSNGAFSNCVELTEVTIPSTVTEWGEWVFRDCSKLQKVTIKEGVTTVGKNAFYGCISLTEVNMPATITKIDKYAFRDCTSLGAVSIPSSVNTLEQYCFQNCSQLTAVNILKESVLNYIGYGAFDNCTALQSIVLPAALYDVYGSNISEFAFDKCNSLEKVVSYSTIPFSQYLPFNASMTKENTTLYVPFGCKQAYLDNQYWSDFKEIVEMEKESLAIDEENFPDEKLRAYLLSQSYGEDAKLTDEEIMGLTSLNVSGQGIKSLQGIRFLTGLDVLDIHNNPISTEAMNSLIKELTVCTSETPNILITVDKNYEDQGVECNDMHVYAAQQKGWKIQYADGSDMTDAPAGTGGATGVKGDVTGDGVVDIADAVHIVNFIVGKVDALAPRQEVNQPNPE